MSVESKLPYNDSFWCKWTSDPFCERKEYEFCIGDDCPLYQRFDSSAPTTKEEDLE